MDPYYVYILSNAARTLYVGVTSDLSKRIHQHKDKHAPGFSARYNVTRLVYFEETSDVRAAIAREKQVKGWTRKRKIELVSSVNPRWEDLSKQEGLLSSGTAGLSLLRSRCPAPCPGCIAVPAYRSFGRRPASSHDEDGERAAPSG